MKVRICMIATLLAAGLLVGPGATGDICNEHIRGSGCQGSGSTGGTSTAPALKVTRGIDRGVPPDPYDNFSAFGGQGEEVDPRVFEGEVCTFLIKRVGNKKNIQVQYVTEDGSAQAPSDYEGIQKSQIIDFREHEGRVVPVNVQTYINEDAQKGPEPDTEFFFLRLVNPVGAKVVKGRGKCVIRNFFFEK